ncbi:permease prefix domain 1-containing protein [Cryptosporangium sp. NPDC048952]|uniref:permease prefix domain 1-containing protein n=1 Tax=Cryptosporangium sp. NPDC048952 TaxID=3363961 RepID=UPI00372405AB
MTGLVDDLRARLHGPSGVRKELLREVEDGLRDAAEAYEEAGVPAAEAARRAADEFGDPAELAPLYQAELDACQGRRSALLIALAYPTLTLTWDALWRFAGVGEGVASDESVTVAGLLDLSSYGAAIAAAILIPLFGRASASWIRRLALGVGGLGWLSLLLTVGTSIWLAQANDASGARAMGTSVPAMLVVALTVASTIAVAISATVTLVRVSRSRALLAVR